MKSNKTAFQGPECPEEVDKVHEVCHIEMTARHPHATMEAWPMR